MPIDEATRQRTLDTYRLADTLPDTAYDDIVKLAACVCDAPIALVTLIDRDRQLFKARLGFAPHETRRSDAFCDHAIRRPDEMMEVVDATLDPRFAGNPLVMGEIAVRFYAGVPLVTPAGAAVGTVCVLDTRPRSLAPSQREALSALARVTMNLFESQHRERELHRSMLFATPLQEAAVPSIAVPASAAAVAEDIRCTVMIVQVQQLDAAVATKGERAVGRQLAALDALLESCVGPGDCVDRATHSGELILVLRGINSDSRVPQLAERIAEFEVASGLRILWSSAVSTSAAERIEAVFLRADDALSDLKDRAVAA